LAPYSAIDVQVTYNPLDDGEDATSLLIQSNDDRYSVSAPFKVDILANG
jgi:hypothetical protein